MISIKQMVLSNNLRIGESVIVTNPKSDNYNKIGAVHKISKYDEIKVSVSFDEDVYRYLPDDLVLA